VVLKTFYKVVEEKLSTWVRVQKKKTLSRCPLLRSLALYIDPWSYLLHFEWLSAVSIVRHFNFSVLILVGHLSFDWRLPGAQSIKVYSTKIKVDSWFEESSKGGRLAGTILSCWTAILAVLLIVISMLTSLFLTFDRILSILVRGFFENVISYVKNTLILW